MPPEEAGAPRTALAGVRTAPVWDFAQSLDEIEQRALSNKEKSPHSRHPVTGPTEFARSAFQRSSTAATSPHMRVAAWRGGEKGDWRARAAGRKNSDEFPARG